MLNARPSDREYSLQPDLQQAAFNDSDSGNRSSFETSFKDPRARSGRNGTLEVSTASLQSSLATFTASTTQPDTCDSATISPMDTRFDVDYTSLGSDIRMSLNGQTHQTAPSNYATFVNKTDPLSTKSRCDSLHSNFEPYSPTTPQTQSGRKRGFEYAEPGSARAIYLEKNRKAASKCRSKQKRQQEELVETAREMERRNKILKTEVQILKISMRDLMELVSQHSECPDTLLKLYVQAKADRLARGGVRNILPLPLSSSSYPGPTSIDKVSPPEDD